MGAPAKSWLGRLSCRSIGKKVDGPRLHGFHAHRNITVAGDENDREQNAYFREPLLQIQPIQVRQPHIKDHAAGPGHASHKTQEIAGRSGYDNPVARGDLDAIAADGSIAAANTELNGSTALQREDSTAGDTARTNHRPRTAVHTPPLTRQEKRRIDLPALTEKGNACDA